VKKGDAISVVDITSPQEEVEVRFIANPLYQYHLSTMFFSLTVGTFSK